MKPGITRKRSNAVFAALSSGTGGVAAKQRYYLGLVLVISVLLAISASNLVFSLQYLSGIVALTAITVVSGFIPWSHIDSRWTMTLPITSILISGILRDVFRYQAPAVALLAFLPALWLALLFRQTGTVVATIAVIMALSAPTVIRAYPYMDSVLLTRSLLIPVVVAQMCFFVALARANALEERARTEQLLREKDVLIHAATSQEQLLHNIINTVDIGIVVLDMHGKTVLANEAYHELQQFAAPPGAAIATESTVVMRYTNTEIAVPVHQRPLARAADRETFKNYVVAFGASSGHGRKISTSARQITDIRGQHSGAVVVLADVTSYFENARRQHQFVAAVSHELRTPLTSILGYLDLVLEDADLNTTNTHHLEVVSRNAEQLLNIVEDLLSTQTVKDSGIALSREAADPGELTRHACETITHAAKVKHIGLDLQIHETPKVTIDVSRMTQAMVNILSNAIKYTPDYGAVTVAVDSDLNHVEIRVSDTGIGMTSEEQANLFTEYYRTPTSKGQDIPGHGLGLSITRVIVLAHSGQISVRSNPGLGSTFTIQLPLT